jgi:ABC-type branched-subunit amino acid transport system substrate-binding protein
LADGWASGVYIMTNHAGQAATRHSTSLTTPFYDDYIRTYGLRPDAAATEAYEAIRILAQGYAAAQTVNPAVVASKLRSRKDWLGLYGTIGFDQRGDSTNRKLFLKQSAERAFVLANPQDTAN